MFRCALIAGMLAACDGAAPTGATRLQVQEEQTMKEDFERENPKWRFGPGEWERRKSGEAWVLAKTGRFEAYNVALLEDRRFADCDVTVRFKPVSGKVDASGGIVFRAKDAENYFVVRANALEDNFRLYAVVDGKRRQIAGTKVKEPAFGRWHTLRVVARGEQIQGYLNGELLIDHKDATFAGGWVGVWTKEDSVTDFDDLIVKGTVVP